LPDRPLANRPRRSRTTCFPCSIWSRSGIGNSFDRDLAPADGCGGPREYNANVAIIRLSICQAPPRAASRRPERLAGFPNGIDGPARSASGHGFPEWAHRVQGRRTMTEPP
jgi:hypothetical protein